MDDEIEYVVIKFTQNDGNEVVERELTRDEAKEICNDPDSSGDGWFYGFDKAEYWT